ncbi:hypothetical protein HX13_01205 [Chryseobacterium sp. P1-3]|uniref:hypothetical protein n=1 Tax=Chryseobacterium sp. (strain P1-3) TaxID=1517683 RepID=UPI0004E6C477|nr:hypothetical protein [Chryseobacterium sp. P1-3]KFF76001.1 hypothetical protein HX13_01205 [Chryseobacterium sp. P1-3]
MDSEFYTQATRYENLVRIAFSCERGSKNGADLNFMKNAMTMENGDTYAKHLGSFEKQFEKVKTYTAKALIKLSKTKPFSTEKDFFLILESKINCVGTTSQLMDIVNRSMDKVLELRE